MTAAAGVTRGGRVPCAARGREAAAALQGGGRPVRRRHYSRRGVAAVVALLPLLPLCSVVGEDAPGSGRG